jgi:hypothetical protein
MRRAISSTVLSAALLLGAGATTMSFLAGCSTDEPGAQYALNTYSTNIDSSPDKVTAAAQKACADLQLTGINGNGTKVDGQVTAYTASGTEVTIKIAQSGDDVSTVKISVGATGDQALSAQLVDRIKHHLSWFGM